MAKYQKNSAVFYKSLTAATEVKSGFLTKSPPQKRLQTEMAWRRRYFVLFKISEQHHELRYFKNPKERDQPLGEISLMQISLLNVNPEHHQKWPWVLRNCKCPPTHVLHLQVVDQDLSRDYFLVGDSSEEVQSWFSVLFEALKKRPHKLLTSQEITGLPGIGVISKPTASDNKSTVEFEMPPHKLRSLSEPSTSLLDDDTDQAKDKESSSRPRSLPPKEGLYDSLPLPVLKTNRSSSLPTSEREPLYEQMDVLKSEEQSSRFFEGLIRGGTIQRSVDQVYHKFKRSSLPTPEQQESLDGSLEKLTSSDYSSSSDALSPMNTLEREAPTPDKPNSSESVGLNSHEEVDIEVKVADLKTHLSLVDIEGKLSVSAWTGQQQQQQLPPGCLLLPGDQINAVNDLRPGSADDFSCLLSKCLKDQVKLTVRRPPGELDRRLENTHSDN